MSRRHLLVSVPIIAAAVLAGCGSSKSDTAAIISPPSQSQTLTFTATSTATGPTGPTGATGATGPTGPTIVTPKTGKLSVEPKITVPAGAAPAKLVKKDLIKGTGAVVRSGDTIAVNYIGALYKGGKVFDASWTRGQTLSTAIGVGAVIPGWDQGLVGMQVGGRRELIIPPTLAYGATGQGTIPGNATLIFIVDVLAVQRASGATGVTGATVAPGALASTAATGTTGASSATGSTGAS